MKRNLGFRFWFYFRQGWSVYFAFIFAAINTLTVTYYLAIEKIPSLQEFFPTFSHYIIIVVGIGIPLLVAIGFVHYKRSSAFKAEAAISWESNPFVRRVLFDTEVNLQLNLKLMEILLKLESQEKLANEDLQKIKDYKNEILEIIKKRTYENTVETDYIKKLEIS